MPFRTLPDGRRSWEPWVALAGVLVLSAVFAILSALVLLSACLSAF